MADDFCETKYLLIADQFQVDENKQIILNFGFPHIVTYAKYRWTN